MRDAIRHFLTEFVGTFALVFFGGAAIVHASLPGGGGLVQVAFAHALILFALVTATMRISGHFNPAVTAGFLVARRIEPLMAGLYVVAQLLAAMLAAYALRGLLPAEAITARLGGQSVALDVTGTQAILLEAIATFMLTFVIFGTAVDPRAPRVGGLAIGMTLGAAILAIGPYTGASLNPARSFGPAVAMGDFTAQAIYWVGPMVGALAAAALYEYLILHRGAEPVDHGAVRPGP